MIVRGTTPTIRFTFSEIDVASIRAAYLTIEQGGSTVIEKGLDEAAIGDGYLEWELTQEETIPLSEKSNVRIQCRYRLDDGRAYASEIYEMKPYEILKEEAI